MQISVDETMLEYRLEGPQSAPCVVLSHGLALDLTMWDEYVERLKGRFRTLRYDSRGHGRSSQGSGEFSLEDLGKDVIRLMDGLGIAKAHFLGLSMGGMVGLGLALRHPDRLLSAAICDARGVATPEYSDSWAQRIGAVRNNGIAAIADTTAERWFTAEFFRNNPKTMENIKTIVGSTSPDGYCWSAAALRRLDYARLLAEVKIPMLFLTGDQDNGAPPGVVRQMHHAVAHSSYFEVPDAGHISVIEQPEAFTKATTAFFEAVTADSEGDQR